MADDLFVCLSTNHGTHFYLNGEYDRETNVLTINTPHHSEVQMDETEVITFGLRGREVNPCATSAFVMGEVLEEDDLSLKVAVEPIEISGNG